MMLRLEIGAFKILFAVFFRTAPMLEQPLKFFVVFFVVVEPVSLIPLFSGLTHGANASYKRRMAGRAVLVAAAILVLFALGGAAFLELMGISSGGIPDFRRPLLFLLSLEMVFARESGHAHLQQRAGREQAARGYLRLSARLPLHRRPRGAGYHPAVVRPAAPGSAVGRCSAPTSRQWGWCWPLRSY